MVSQSRANFGGHRHHCSGEILLLVVEGQDSTCTGLNLLLRLSLKNMTCHVHTHEVSGCRYNHLAVCPFKDSQCW